MLEYISVSEAAKKWGISERRVQKLCEDNVCAKKFLLKPFVKTYLKKQQSIYVQDLEKVLANE